jgi:hypothetical protein
MRCFTDGEIRRGLIAVWSADPEADLFDVFVLAASTPETTATVHELTANDDQARADQQGRPNLETTRRKDR